MFFDLSGKEEAKRLLDELESGILFTNQDGELFFSGNSVKVEMLPKVEEQFRLQYNVRYANIAVRYKNLSPMEK